MRILLVSQLRKDPDAGASLVYHLLEEGLRTRGHMVKTLHYEDFGIPRPFERIVNRAFLAQASSRRAAQENLDDFDVIMGASGMLYPLFKDLKRRANRPLLVNQLHGAAYFDHQARITETLRGHMSLSWMYRTFTGPLTVQDDASGSRYADLTVVQNTRDEDFLMEQGFPRVVRIPLAAHQAIVEGSARAPLAEDRDPHRLFWFGSWVERKACYYLPRAFKIIAEAVPEARLTIGGTGLGEEFIKGQFAAELRSRIVVLPRISRAEQIAEFDRQSIFLFPSLSEGFGFALLEAMWMGLAPVTTPTGLGVDMLLDRENALMIPPASALHIAKATIELIRDRDLRCRIARNAQATARRWSNDDYIDAYESAFESRRPTSAE